MDAVVCAKSSSYLAGVQTKADTTTTTMTTTLMIIRTISCEARVWVKNTHQTCSQDGEYRKTYGSGIERRFFMFLSCWKWNDMSVQSTISITSVRKYLSMQHKHTLCLKKVNPFYFCDIFVLTFLSVNINFRRILSEVLTEDIQWTYNSRRSVRNRLIKKSWWKVVEQSTTDRVWRNVM